MKTWEMIKALTEDKSLKFKIVGSQGNENILHNATGHLVFGNDNHPAFLSSNFLMQDWEIVPQPVSFMEAAKALEEDKKTIICEYPNYNHREHICKEVFNRAEGEYPELTFYMILNGKWYIEQKK